MEIAELRALQGELAELGLPDLQVKPIQFFILEVNSNLGNPLTLRTNLLREFFFESMESQEEILKTVNQRKIRLKMQDFFNEEGKRKCRGKVGFATWHHLMNLVKLPEEPEKGRYVIFGFRTQQKLLKAKIWELAISPYKPSWTLMQINDQTVSQIHRLIEETPFFSTSSENI